MRAQVLIDYAKNALAEHYGYIWGTSGQLWTAEDQRRLEKTTDADRANSRKYGSQWIGHHVTDCSGLIYRPCVNNGVKMTHGSNTMYLSYCSAKGKLIAGRRQDGQPLKPGTAVFTYNQKTGKYGHVGLYIGDGLVIEAMGAKNGVVTSKIDRWGFWGELKGITYDGEDMEPAIPGQEDHELTPTFPTLRRGAKGEAVRRLQQSLIDLGYDLGSYGADGDFGRATEAAVKAFQQSEGIQADGICGAVTWKHIREAEGNDHYTVTVKGLSREQAKVIVEKYPNAKMVLE